MTFHMYANNMSRPTNNTRHLILLALLGSQWKKIITIEISFI